MLLFGKKVDLRRNYKKISVCSKKFFISYGQFLIINLECKVRYWATLILILFVMLLNREHLLEFFLGLGWMFGFTSGVESIHLDKNLFESYLYLLMNVQFLML